MNYSYEELAGMIDHSLLHPALTDKELSEGIHLARRYRVASVCVKPYAVRGAVDSLRGSRVQVGTVVGFPHGSATTEVKRFETECACRDGATEIDIVVNVGKVLSEDWDYVEQELRTVVDAAHRHGALVKVIFENDFLTDDVLKVNLCRICAEVRADFVKTSTGFGFVQHPDGHYFYRGATEADLKLMRSHSPPAVQIKAAGGVRDLDALMRVRELGCTRAGATATASILEEYKRRVKISE